VFISWIIIDWNIEVI